MTAHQGRLRPALSARAPDNASGTAIKETAMTTPTTVTFVGAKGGVGTSTVATLHAIALARREHTVRLTSTHTAGVEDLAALLGVPAPGAGETVTVLPRLTLADQPCADGHTVVDAGTDCFSDHDGPVYVVLRNDYLSLRRALAGPRTTAGIILISEPNRSLTRRDVADVLAHPIVAELRLDPAIARAIDAGLLSSARHLRIDLSLGATTTSAH